MHTFSVTSATYDGTGRDSTGVDNPSVLIIGTVDGHQYPFATTWAQIHSTNSAGGSSAVKLVLQTIMLNTFIIYRFIPAEPQQQTPVYHGAIPAPAAPSAYAGRINVPEALVGSWSA
jgi:hypothetical protein